MRRMLDDRDSEDITIRLATASDAVLLAGFRYDFRSNLNPPNENKAAFVQRCGAWMQDRLREGGAWRCWIAEQDRSSLGCLWMQIIEKAPNPIVEPEHHAYVTNFYVREEARGKGLGSKMLAVALDWARSQDVQAVILWPTAQSRSLYIRHGFATPGELLELVISPPS